MPKYTPFASVKNHRRALLTPTFRRTDCVCLSHPLLTMNNKTNFFLSLINIPMLRASSSFAPSLSITYISAFNLLTVPKETLATGDKRGLETFQLGIWKVSLLKRATLNFGKRFLDFKEAFGYFKRLAIDVYTLEPILATFFILNELWSGVQTALIIEIGFIQGAPETGAILKAVAVRIFFVIFAAVLQWESERVLPTLKTRITTHFELYSMRAQLRIDLPTSQEPRSKVRATSNDAWTSFEGIVEFLNNVMKALSQPVLIVQVSRSTGSPLFAAVCIMKPIFLTLTQRTLWNTGILVFYHNLY
ncbi:hypothetical protein ARMSODRAFT_725756 [Armillaria solidipes]|uniref:Uncharacterized protein n=1 Tax=Armillaria solidipes TaxID=1076256 RepID=A0A2H3B9Q0_9AGAR|nr:hypothetical protein ARMSODRAFT_725756 [Armillaria solidipes]